MNLGPKVASPMSPEAWAGVSELSEQLVKTAGGRFRLIEEDEQSSLSRNSLYLPFPDFDGNAADVLAQNLEDRYQPGRYQQMLEEMRIGGRKVIVNKMAAELDEGKNIVVNMNHPSLIRSGIGFRLLSRALEEKGVEFDKAIIGGIALAGVEVSLDTDDESEGGFIPAYDAVGFVSNHLFVSVPNTKRASRFREKHKKEVDEHNSQMKEKLQELLNNKKGVLLMMLGSGTHDKPHKNNPDIIEIAPISESTIKLMRENRLGLVQAAVSDPPGKPMSFYLLGGPRNLLSTDQMHREMHTTAGFLTANSPDKRYIYLRPKT